MIDEKLEQELARFEKNFVKYSKKNPEQYQFGEAFGTHLLESEHLSPEQRERVEKQIESQKQRIEQCTAKANKNKTEPDPKTKKLKL
ncbi:hypothetical protein R7127_26165, partial [Vibrio sp. 1159]